MLCVTFGLKSWPQIFIKEVQSQETLEEKSKQTLELDQIIHRHPRLDQTDYII